MPIILLLHHYIKHMFVAQESEATEAGVDSMLITNCVEKSEQ